MSKDAVVRHHGVQCLFDLRILIPAWPINPSSISPLSPRITHFNQINVSTGHVIDTLDYRIRMIVYHIPPSLVLLLLLLLLLLWFLSDVPLVVPAPMM
jgi:hypothetical protein